MINKIAYKKENLYLWNNFVRPVIYKIKGKKCEICGSTKNVDLHHTSYEAVDIKTIRVLCRKCHQKVHKGEQI